MGGEPADGTPQAAYHQVLRDREAAIAARGGETAAPLATMTRDMGHELDDPAG